ncbi:hypothetical protein N665_0812s0012 [Sinapis alba]|nr:hypothetical protein N665_0812s0012 [Sinapis alba]
MDAVLKVNGKENATTGLYLSSLQCLWQKTFVGSASVFFYSGHFIQHCPTNGDPNYDVKRIKPPTCIPKSMLAASGAVVVLKPNEDAFEKQVEGLPSTTRSVGELPAELKCPL